MVVEFLPRGLILAPDVIRAGFGRGGGGGGRGGGSGANGVGQTVGGDVGGAGVVEPPW